MLGSLRGIFSRLCCSRLRRPPVWRLHRLGMLAVEGGLVMVVTTVSKPAAAAAPRLPSGGGGDDVLRHRARVYVGDEAAR